MPIPNFLTLPAEAKAPPPPPAAEGVSPRGGRVELGLPLALSDTSSSEREGKEPRLAPPSPGIIPGLIPGMIPEGNGCWLEFKLNRAVEEEPEAARGLTNDWRELRLGSCCCCWVFTPDWS